LLPYDVPVRREPREATSLSRGGEAPIPLAAAGRVECPPFRLEEIALISTRQRHRGGLALPDHTDDERSPVGTRRYA